MRDSHCRDAERRVQRVFSKSSSVSALALALLVLGMAALLRANRPPLNLSAASFAVQWTRVAVPQIAGSRVRISGAWALTTNDRRAGGFSGLTIDRERLLGLTDGGMLVWLPFPPTSGPGLIRPLPAVAGNPRTKLGRDSEAIAPGAGGWWVAFEQRHQLIRYSRDFGAAVGRIPLHHPAFRPNRGVEAIAVAGHVVAYPETSGVSDAAVTRDGRVVLLKRRFGPLGFRSRISDLREGDVTLPLGPLDNPEGLAAQPLAGGGTRLWVITDNDQRRWLPTLLVAVDVPPASGR